MLVEDLIAKAQQATGLSAEVLARNPQGKHTYSLEEFGLTAARVRRHFQDYCGRYGISQRQPSN